MNMTAFWITWFVLSALTELYEDYRMNKRINSNHKMNKQIKRG